MAIKLKIMTPEREVLNEDVDAVYLQSTGGELGVLPKHVPMAAPLAIGVLNYVKNGEKHPVAVMGGMFHTDGAEASILSDAAELSDQIDAVRAQQAKQRAEALLHEKSAHVDTKRAEMALARSLVRLKLSGKN